MESPNHRIKVLIVIRSKYPFFTDENTKAKRADGTCLSGYRVCSGAVSGSGPSLLASHTVHPQDPSLRWLHDRAGCASPFEFRTVFLEKQWAQGGSM